MGWNCNFCGRGYFASPPEAVCFHCGSRVVFVKDHHARHTDPETSHEQALYARTRNARVDNAILDVLREAGEPLTSREITDRCPWERVSVSPRLKPLEKMGFVERAGRRGRGITWRLRSAEEQRNQS